MPDWEKEKIDKFATKLVNECVKAKKVDLCTADMKGVKDCMMPKALGWAMMKAHWMGEYANKENCEKAKAFVNEASTWAWAKQKADAFCKSL